MRVRSAQSFVYLLLRRLPFSVAMILAIFGTAAVTNTLAHPIPPELLDRWGFGVEQIRDGRMYQLFLAPFQVLRPYMVITITGILLLFLGACEYRLGTWRAMVAFWVGHTVGYVGGGLVFAGLSHFGSEWATAALLVTDVGASNGAFGAAGTAIVFLAPRARRVTFLTLSAYLAIALLVERKVWDAEHILAFAAGLTVGRVYLWRMGKRWPGLMPHWELERRQHPSFVSLALTVLGIVNILGAFLIPHHAGFARLESWLPYASALWPRHLLLVTGVVLLTLTRGLSRGQRPAWWGAVATLLFSLVLQLHVGVTWLEAVLAAAFLTLLLAWRRDFRGPGHPPSLRSGLNLLAALLIAVPLYGLIGFFVLRSEFTPAVGVVSALSETFVRVFFSSPEGIVTAGRPARWFLESIPVAAWLGVVIAVSRIVQSALAPEVSSTDREIAQGLLKTSGDSGTAYMTLWPGNALFLGPGQKCYVAYRVNAGIAVALGDPVGPPGVQAETIAAFGHYADGQGWTPAFYGATAAHLDEYRRQGYEALQIGEEAVIRLPGLEFRGKEWQSVRSAANRAAREGVTFQMYEGGSLPPEVRAQCFEISAEWSAQHEVPPMGFTLGKTEDVDNPDINVAVATDATGHVHAYVDWLPVYGRRGWVIDLMQRRNDAMGGVMDYLISMSLLAFKERGYETASLATAPLANLDRGETSSLVQWVLGQVYDKSRTYYDFRSLFQYKEKFQPQWESVYLMHRGLRTLPAVGTALMFAYLPDLNLTDATRLLGEAAANQLFRSSIS